MHPSTAVLFAYGLCLGHVCRKSGFSREDLIAAEVVTEVRNSLKKKKIELGLRLVGDGLEESPRDVF